MERKGGQEKKVEYEGRSTELELNNTEQGWLTTVIRTLKPVTTKDHTEGAGKQK